MGLLLGEENEKNIAFLQETIFSIGKEAWEDVESMDDDMNDNLMRRGKVSQRQQKVSSASFVGDPLKQS